MPIIEEEAPQEEPIVEAVVETPVEVDTDEDEDDDFAGLDDDADLFEAPDPDSIITVRTSGGDTKYVPATRAMTPIEILASARLTTSGAIQYWYNGAQITDGTEIQPGSTLTVVGSVKGG